MGTIIVTGTGTDVGKTVTTAAVAALAHADGQRVVVVKPAQTGLAPGEPGDLADVTRLSGVTRTLELARYPDPLAPATAARRAGRPPLRVDRVVDAVGAPGTGSGDAGAPDLVLVEGAGGLLVRFDDDGATLADVALGLAAAGVAVEVLLVASAGLGVLNSAALTAEALRVRGIPLLGTVVGAWPAEPDLAARCNLTDLPVVTEAPLLGVLPAGLGGSDRDRFMSAARCGLGPLLGGRWSAPDPP